MTTNGTFWWREGRCWVAVWVGAFVFGGREVVIVGEGSKLALWRTLWRDI